MKMNINRLKKY